MKAWANLIVISCIILVINPFIKGCSWRDAGREERTIGKFVDDKRITAEVKLNLLQVADLKNLDISAYSYLGRVYLIGVVEKESQGDRAFAIANQVEGVNSVTTYFLNKNDEITGKWPDDRIISAMIRAKLTGDEELKSTQIEVKTIMGHVVLLGVVGSERDSNKAIRYARSVENVRQVKCFIIVW